MFLMFTKKIFSDNDHAQLKEAGIKVISFDVDDTIVELEKAGSCFCLRTWC